jgi:hypothetical protein
MVMAALAFPLPPAVSVNQDASVLAVHAHPVRVVS